VQELRTVEFELFALIERTNDPNSAQKLLHQITVIAAASYVIGAHGAMTDTARVFFERSRAKYMRISRATSSEESGLRAAINAAAKASGGQIPSGQPYKDAESIMAEVSARMGKPVSVDVIARRIAALFKNAKK
jgi:hypothetical protein